MFQYKTVIVSNEKGGVGKTTLSIHIASIMAALGYRTLLIDAAPQGNATKSLGLRPRPDFYDWLVREDTVPEDVITPVTELERIAIPGRDFTGKLFVIRGNKETVGVPSHVSSNGLRIAIEEVEDAVDLIIIDTDPSVSAMAAMLYSAADAMIIPSKMAFLDINAVINTLKDAPRQAQREIPLLGIVPTFFEKSKAVHHKNYAGLRKFAEPQGLNVWYPIRNLTGFELASNQQRMVYTLQDASAQQATNDLYKLMEHFRKEMMTSA